MSPFVLGSLSVSPMLLLAGSIALVVVLIGVCRVHAFLALLAAAGAVAVMTATEQSPAAAIESMLAEFGKAVGSIGFSIAIAAVIGAALMESGAADRIVRSFLSALGVRRAPLALLSAGFVLGVPVFFDTVFFLLIPLARALSARTGKNYLLHVMAICTGGVITHATVPPTPGPLAMVEILRLDLGLVLVAGLAAGIVPAAGGLLFSKWADRRWPTALRAAPGSTLESVAVIARRDESKLPGFGVSIAPVVLPVVLIAVVSVAGTWRSDLSPAWWNTLEFLGNKNVALLLGALIAIAVYLRKRNLGWRDTGGIVSDPLATAGVIILITAAGGAYGAMIRNAGIGEVMRNWVEHHGLDPLLVAWGLAALLRAAQGSTTVAVISTASLLTALGGEAGLGVHPIYLYLATGYGGLFLSWMNDSGFWLYSRMSGLTEGETLRSWTVLLSLISLLGLAEVRLAAALFPFAP